MRYFRQRMFHCFRQMDYSISQIDHKWVSGVVCVGQTTNWIKTECNQSDVLSSIECASGAVFISSVFIHLLALVQCLDVWHLSLVVYDFHWRSHLFDMLLIDDLHL